MKSELKIKKLVGNIMYKKYGNDIPGDEFYNFIYPPIVKIKHQMDNHMFLFKDSIKKYYFNFFSIKKTNNN